MKHPLILSSTLLLSFLYTASQASTGNVYDSIVRNSGNTPRYIQNNSPSQTTKIETYFDHVIDSPSSHYNGKQLSFQKRECIKYGEIDVTGLQQEACVNSRITIALENLEVIEATKGLFLFKKQRLEVKSNIKREFLNINLLSKKEAGLIKAQLTTNPETINIPILSNYDPKKVAEKLKR